RGAHAQGHRRGAARMNGTVLVLGGTGCIGAVVVRDLLGSGAGRVVVASRAGTPGLLPLWLPAPFDRRIVLAAADLGEPAAVQRLVAEHRPTHVVHLGGLQSPDCDADPAQGLAVNVGGTQVLLEAVERLAVPLQRFVFASSAAVYGPRSLYPGPVVGEDEPLQPPNRYGVWKLAGEHVCRLFAQRTGVPTVCLRLNTTYGKGRDRGRTAAPTTAMKHVAAGAARGSVQPFAMPYRGRENYHFVEDVGACFARVTTAPFTGFGAFNIRGTTVEVAAFLAVIRDVARSLGMAQFCDLSIAGDASENLFVSDLDDRAIQATFAGLPCTPLADGVRRSLLEFQHLAAASG
ncbi:MAG TPA: NAD-dependent epimerase/dehydratase family protein, partial [Planctomycetota bacterium]|nr:NAD-dependent epimerase/dehydratase family protein [Planctomycetota bacterium]